MDVNEFISTTAFYGVAQLWTPETRVHTFPRVRKSRSLIYECRVEILDFRFRICCPLTLLLASPCFPPVHSGPCSPWLRSHPDNSALGYPPALSKSFSGSQEPQEQRTPCLTVYETAPSGPQPRHTSFFCSPEQKFMGCCLPGLSLC